MPQVIQLALLELAAQRCRHRLEPRSRTIEAVGRRGIDGRDPTPIQELVEHVLPKLVRVQDVQPRVRQRLDELRVQVGQQVHVHPRPVGRQRLVQLGRTLAARKANQVHGVRGRLRGLRLRLQPTVDQHPLEYVGHRTGRDRQVEDLLAGLLAQPLDHGLHVLADHRRNAGVAHEQQLVFRTRTRQGVVQQLLELLRIAEDDVVLHQVGGDHPLLDELAVRQVGHVLVERAPWLTDAVVPRIVHERHDPANRVGVHVQALRVAVLHEVKQLRRVDGIELAAGDLAAREEVRVTVVGSPRVQQ